MNLPSNAFFQLVGSRWKLVKAICIHESAGDANAVGDNGDAQGLFQLHRAFAQDWVIPANNELLIIMRGVPFVSILIMKNFIRACGDLMKDADVIGNFHDGHKGWAERGDKDGYVKAVLAILATL
jgi:Transglycosylase SLT domain